MIYIIWELILWLFNMVFNRFVNAKFDVKDLAFIFIKPMGNYWYIYVLLVLYIFIYIFKLYKNSTIGLIITGLMCVVISLFNGIPVTLYRIFYFSFFLYFGIFINEHRSIITNRLVFINSLILSVLCFIIYFVTDFNVFENKYLKPIIAIIICIVFLYLFNLYSKLSCKFLCLCGKYCIYIYLVHIFITAANRAILPMIGIHNIYISLVLNAVFALFISLGIAVLCNKVYILNIFFKPLSVINRLKSNIYETK